MYISTVLVHVLSYIPPLPTRYHCMMRRLCSSDYIDDYISEIDYMSMGSRKCELSVSFVNHRAVDKKASFTLPQ